MGNIRKNSAFVKGKLEQLRESQRNALENEFKKLNLVRYKAEAISTLTTTKYKAIDLPLACFICELFHHRFQDFQDLLKDAWKSIFNKYKTVFSDHKKQERKKNMGHLVNKIPEGLDIPKLKLDIKFVAELTCLGILPEKNGLGMLMYILSQFTVENMIEGKQKD